MEDFNKVKDHIIKTYLKDNALHEVKKKAIEKLLKQTRYAIIEALKEKDATIEIIDEEYYAYLKNGMKNAWLNKLIEQAIKISEFENLEVLENLTYYASFEYEANNSFYGEFIELYLKLKAFKDSGIDESNFTKEIKSLNKKREELQKFSTSKIELDKIPQHLTDIILDFLNSNYYEDENSVSGCEWVCYKENALKIINSIIVSLNIRFKGEYKTKPHPTITSKKKWLKEKEFGCYVNKLINGKLSNIEKEEGEIKFAEFLELDREFELDRKIAKGISSSKPKE